MPRRRSNPAGRSVAEATVRFAVGWCLKTEGYCPIHSHPTLEIVYHARGRGTSRVNREQMLDFGPRDVTIYPATIAHDQTTLTPGEDRCIHLYADGLDIGDTPFIAVSRLNDAYAVRELTALSEARLPTAALQVSWLNHRAHALLAYLLLCANQRERTDNANTASAYAEHALDYIASHAGTLRSLAEVADHVGVSHDYLRHVFHSRYGMSLKRWHVLVRVALAKQVLRYSAVPIKAVAAECGFATDRHFCSCFRAEVGVTPMTYRLASSDRNIPHDGPSLIP